MNEETLSKIEKALALAEEAGTAVTLKPDELRPLVELYREYLDATDETDAESFWSEGDILDEDDGDGVVVQTWGEEDDEDDDTLGFGEAEFA